MKALTVKQPWASLIVHGIKDIENRTWKTNFRGRIYIHASSVPGKEPYMIFDDKQSEIFIEQDLSLKMLELYKQTSRIIGEVDIIDCVINHPSIWAEKSEGVFVGNTFLYKEGDPVIWNWVLANPIEYKDPILNVKGKLSFWQPEWQPCEKCNGIHHIWHRLNPNVNLCPKCD